MTGNKIKIYQAKVLIHSNTTLVQPHRPHSDKAFCIPNIRCSQANFVFINTTYQSSFSNGSLHYIVPILLKSFSMLPDKACINTSVLNQHSSNCMMQYNVSAGI